MQKVINCPCGFAVNAETDDQLVAKAQQHAKEVHQNGSHARSGARNVKADPGLESFLQKWRKCVELCVHRVPGSV